MTPEEAVTALNALDGRDQEHDEAAAVSILLDLASAEVREAYGRAADRWAGGGIWDAERRAAWARRLAER